MIIDPQAGEGQQIINALESAQAALNPLSGFLRVSTPKEESYLESVRDKIRGAIATRATVDSPEVRQTVVASRETWAEFEDLYFSENGLGGMLYVWIFQMHRRRGSGPPYWKVNQWPNRHTRKINIYRLGDVLDWLDSRGMDYSHKRGELCPVYPPPVLGTG